MGRHGDGEMGRRGDTEMGRHGDTETGGDHFSFVIFVICHLPCIIAQVTHMPFMRHAKLRTSQVHAHAKLRTSETPIKRSLSPNGHMKNEK